jgi:TonB family protein
MGKILKYCSSCEEGFAERFGFCPDCGAPLQAFEMNPLTGEMTEPATAVQETPAVVQEEVREEPAVFEAAVTEDVEIIEPAEPDETEVFEEPAPAVAAAAAPQVFYQPTTLDADGPKTFAQAETATSYDWEEDGYHITVIQEKNAKERNLLLLGSAILMLSLSVGATIVSLFTKDIGVGAIGDETSLAMLLDDVPMPVEEQEEQKKNDDDAGGGGGGGRQDKEETSQGDLADQTREQILIKPDVRIYKNDNFELKQPVAMTEGDNKFEKKYDRYGDPNSKFAGLSNGPGSGGGQGSGVGTGQGSGYGTGAGSGTGSGYGSGTGDGTGSGTGSGRDGGPPPPTAPRVTSPLKILSKPKATYTDAARTNGVQGSVRLKVTLLASGSVGSIVPVTRLPHGLTEQAIAAARQIRFEPKKVNGVPITTTVTFDYGFNIY